MPSRVSLKIINIVLSIAYALFGLFVIYTGIYLTYEITMEWILTMVLYLGVQAVITAMFVCYAIYRDNNRILTQCGGMMIIALLLKVIVISIYGATDKSDLEKHEKVTYDHCERIFPKYICSHEVIITIVTIFYIILELACLVSIIAFIRRTSTRRTL